MSQLTGKLVSEIRAFVGMSCVQRKKLPGSRLSKWPVSWPLICSVPRSVSNVNIRSAISFDITLSGLKRCMPGQLLYISQ